MTERTFGLPESFERRRTREVRVGSVVIGGDAPILVQSMITEPTSDIERAAAQIIQLHAGGAEIVRVTTPTMNDARALADIKTRLRSTYSDVPLVADVHHQGTNIAVESTKYVEKVRINPGLFVYHKRGLKEGEYTDVEIAEQQDEIDKALRPVIEACRQEGVAMRIGSNHGSLAERIMVMYGDTPLGMVKSVTEYIQICEAYGFKDIVISLKASDVSTMIAANRLMVSTMEAEGMDYPLHLGVTEAGKDQQGIVKGTLGIGTLLMEGIGDTIRTSLTGDPVSELSVCYDILQATGRRITKGEIVACPGCGRTKFDLVKVYDQIKGATEHLKMKVGVMGCIVNGPGEMADAKYGCVGLAGGKIALYRGKEEVRRVPEEEAKPALVELIKADGNWIDPPQNSTL